MLRETWSSFKSSTKILKHQAPIKAVNSITKCKTCTARSNQIIKLTTHWTPMWIAIQKMLSSAQTRLWSNRCHGRSTKRNKYCRTNTLKTAMLTIAQNLEQFSTKKRLSKMSSARSNRFSFRRALGMDHHTVLTYFRPRRMWGEALLNSKRTACRLTCLMIMKTCIITIIEHQSNNHLVTKWLIRSTGHSIRIIWRKEEICLLNQRAQLGMELNRRMIRHIVKSCLRAQLKSGMSSLLLESRWLD